MSNLLLPSSLRQILLIVIHGHHVGIETLLNLPVELIHAEYQVGLINLAVVDGLEPIFAQHVVVSVNVLFTWRCIVVGILGVVLQLERCHARAVVL